MHVSLSAVLLRKLLRFQATSSFQAAPGLTKLGVISKMASTEVLNRLEQRAVQAEQMIETLTKQVII